MRNRPKEELHKDVIKKIKALRVRNFSLAFISTVLEVPMQDVIKHTKGLEIDLRTIHNKIDPYKDVYPCYTSLFSEMPQHKQDYYNNLNNGPSKVELFDKRVAESKSRYLPGMM